MVILFRLFAYVNPKNKEYFAARMLLYTTRACSVKPWRSARVNEEINSEKLSLFCFQESLRPRCPHYANGNLKVGEVSIIYLEIEKHRLQRGGSISVPEAPAFSSASFPVETNYGFRKLLRFPYSPSPLEPLFSSGDLPDFFSLFFFLRRPVKISARCFSQRSSRRTRQRRRRRRLAVEPDDE